MPPASPVPIVPPANLAFEAFRSALRSLREAGVPALLLRERTFEAEAATAEGDYDLLLPSGPAGLKALARWCGAASEAGASVRIHSPKPEKRLSWIEGPNRAEGGVLADLWLEHPFEVPGRRAEGPAAARAGDGARVRCAPRVLFYTDLLPHARLVGDVLRLEPWLELVLYLAHLFEKKKDLRSPGVVERLQRYAQLHASLDASSGPLHPGLREEVLGLPGRLLAGGASRLEAGQTAWRALQAAGLPGLPPARLRALRTRWARRWRSVRTRLLRQGAVAVMGPDGAGKTTLLESLAASPPAGASPLSTVIFKRLYRKSPVRIIYKTVRKLRRLRNRDEAKEVVEVGLAPILFLGACFRFALLRLFGGRRRVMVFDRYFPDLLVTNRKDAGQALEWSSASSWLARRVPVPDAAVVLAIRAEALASRKAEMSSENAASYTRLMTEHFLRHPPRELLVLRTDWPLERSVELLRATVARADPTGKRERG